MQNILELIGNTPIVRINKLNPNKNVNIFAKLEGNNPGGSIKDRIALKMIEEAEKDGKTDERQNNYRSDIRKHGNCYCNDRRRERIRR